MRGLEAQDEIQELWHVHKSDKREKEGEVFVSWITCKLQVLGVAIYCIGWAKVSLLLNPCDTDLEWISYSLIVLIAWHFTIFRTFFHSWSPWKAVFLSFPTGSSLFLVYIVCWKCMCVVGGIHACLWPMRICYGARHIFQDEFSPKILVELLHPLDMRRHAL